MKNLYKLALSLIVLLGFISCEESSTETRAKLTFAEIAKASTVTSNSAAITWKSSELASAVVYYGTTVNYSDSVVVAETITGSVTLDSLDVETTYHVMVKVMIEGETLNSDDFTFTTTEELPITIAEARGLDKDASVLVEGIITAKEEFDNDKGTFFMQDETAGLAIFWNAENADFTANVKPGMKVRFTGTMGEYNGLVQINPTTFSIIDETINMPAAKEIKLSELEAHQSQLVIVKAIEGVSTDEFNWSGNKNYTIYTSTDSADIRIDGDTDIDGNPIGKFPKDIIGLVGHYYTPQLLPRSMDDIIGDNSAILGFLSGPMVTTTADTSVTIAWETTKSATANLKFGTDFTNLTETVNISEDTTFTRELTGLTANTVYYFQVTISSGDEEISSTVMTFTTKAEEPISILDAKAKNKGDVIYVEGIITAKEEFDNDKGTFFMQDETAGLAIYWNTEDTDFTANVKPGMKVRLKGTLGEFKGLIQINPTSFEIVDSSINMPAAKEVTLDQLETHQGLLVIVNGVEGLGSSTDTVWGSNKNYTINVGSITAAMRIDGDTDIDGTTIGSFPKNITGIVGYYNSPQLLPRSTADIN